MKIPRYRRFSRSMACPLSSRGTCSPDFPDFPAQAYSLLTLALPLASADQWRPPISNLEQYGGASMKRCARLLEDFLYDLCFGLRQLLRNPLVSGVCVLTLLWASARMPPSSAPPTRCCFARFPSRMRITWWI